MKAFFGIHVSMGLVHLLSLYDYWSTNALIAAYQPHLANCCGLSRVLFKDRSAILDYNNVSSKPPVKWGYKCRCACDTVNCYMMLTFTKVLAVHWRGCLGATGVLHMMEPLYDCNPHIYPDNVLSISLANKLKDSGTVI